MNIGDRIKERRKELKISIDEMAEALSINRATAYRYEKGDIENIPISKVEPLANLLKTTITYIISGTDQQKPLYEIFSDCDKFQLKEIYQNIEDSENISSTLYDTYVAKIKNMSQLTTKDCKRIVEYYLTKEITKRYFED